MNMLQKAFNKAAGLIKKLETLQKKYPEFKPQVKTSRASIYESNVKIETNIPLDPDDGRHGKMSVKVYHDGTIAVQYGIVRRNPDDITTSGRLTEVFQGFRANKKAAAFIKEKAMKAGLIPAAR
jgi:hypothetical protein